MLRILVPLLLSLGLAVAAETSAADGKQSTGTVGQLVLAWKVYAEGLQIEDPVLVLTGIRIARGIGQRAATGWGGDPLDPPEEEPTQAPGLPQDPASDAALALALIMAEGDPGLADLAEVIASALTQATPVDLVTSGRATVGAGKADSYQIAFNGQVPAEIAVIAHETGPLQLRVEGPEGQPVCQSSATLGPIYCGFTPVQNDYFTVIISNRGKEPQDYRLITN